jgi:tetrahydromethanopterin S-methyltransferase subunit G
MGFIEEGRQLIQDFVTPEIRAIEVRLDAVEKQISALDSKVDRNHTALDAKIDRNHTQILDTLHRMENYVEVRERLARLEGKAQNVA